MSRSSLVAFAALVWSATQLACAQEILLNDAGGMGVDAAVNADAAADAGMDGADAAVHDDAALAGDDATVPGEDATASHPDATFVPNEPCRELVLPCLDSSDPAVLEVPTEMNANQAFAAAQANQTIQLKNTAIGSGFRIPAFVTLRGCEGGRIAGNVAFAGTGGTLEGLDVTGEVIANQTGTFVIRYNRFSAGGSTAMPGVSARSTDALVSATVNAIVDSNYFSGRETGIEAATSYDTMTHEVNLTATNNIFVDTQRGIWLSEGGLVGVVTAKIEHNTFYGFEDAVTISSVTAVTALRGNLFSSGDRAVSATSAFSVEYTFMHQVTTAYSGTLIGGTFAEADPAFVDAANGDFRLSPASQVLDQIPTGAVVPNPDYQGCPRPANAFGGSSVAMGDIGAIEAQ